VQVHLEARRLGLRGLSRAELPNAWRVLKAGWLSTVPLILLVVVLLSGRTPFAAAFWAISACIAVLLVQKLRGLGLEHGLRGAAQDILDGFVLGAKQSLSVTAAAALVGVVIGVVTLTGVGFKIAYMVTGVAADWAGSVSGWLSVLPFEVIGVDSLTLLFTLLLTAVVCILMGCGIPTTANYIIMVAVAAPILGLLGVQPLVAHFFVFYYGVLADIHAPCGDGGLCCGGYCRGQCFQGRQYGVPAGNGQGFGAICLCVLAIAVAGHGRVHLGGVLPCRRGRGSGDLGLGLGGVELAVCAAARDRAAGAGSGCAVAGGTGSGGNGLGHRADPADHAAPDDGGLAGSAGGALGARASLAQIGVSVFVPPPRQAPARPSTRGFRCRTG